MKSIPITQKAKIKKTKPKAAGKWVQAAMQLAPMVMGMLGSKQESSKEEEDEK